ncbi:MAG: glycerol-3-phosphate dehydrogenase/oxidase [Deltaproteobacteria bacterium]|nr:glycerol-3-phosphate dehydrogenase/oxidase [Deltaproteobacteria bacterium]
MSFSYKTRAHDLSKINSEVFDIAIIGGGVTGAAVARDAALRGLKVVLLEAGDFASGTSSGSSKLLHGGVRYLENYEFKLVRHAIHERELLKKLYAPMVKDLEFVFPTFKRKFPARWMLNIGLFLYDAFSRFRVHHKNYSAKEAAEMFPVLKSENLSGACVYIDSFAEDFRVVIELIKSAHKNSAVCLSRMKVKSFSQEGNLQPLLVEDTLDSVIYKIRSKFVFNCSGPFSDEVRKMWNLDDALKLTQGVHFLIPREKLPINTAFVLPDPENDRILFAIPWKSSTYFGTTDTSIRDPHQARATEADLNYILSMVNKYFRSNIIRADVYQSWAAVRPLLKPAKAESNSEISREHKIEENPKNIFHILGGKLTSHRLMAQEALDHLKNRVEMQECLTAEKSLEIDTAWESSSLEEQVKYCIENEMALMPLDFIRRRTSLYYEMPTQQIAEKVTETFAKIFEWKSEQKNQALDEILHSYTWDKPAH